MDKEDGPDDLQKQGCWWDGSKEEEKQSTTEGVEGRGASALYRAAGVDTGSTRQSSTTRQVALLLFFFFPHSFF